MGQRKYMSSLKRIVCLANSWKLQERCIAGMDIETGKWIRPVCDLVYPQDGRIPEETRLIQGKEPELLQVLEIPLAETGNDFGFECENRSVLPGKWNIPGWVKPQHLIERCENFPYILHNELKYVNPSSLQALPKEQRYTLQLVRTREILVQKSSSGKTGWRGTLQTLNGQTLTDAKITDPTFVEKLETGYNPTGDYLVTVSLSMPWAPPDWEGEAPSWKLIVGVIEISNG
ncbi:hypothetical protein [Oscillatoria sp. FACHB-1406]|uniref:dual OB domain-containing protein n=1 Tax=Oscillatoria sp. FACHB-1406 TaxID=2692846 RepID=UPI0016854585|nr:hypothetical protein [Oscillatoria sp. FACHB-1406]MBD2579273.1 hypothetical protein [Oscillatoria sp. FACHB-1406]